MYFKSVICLLIFCTVFNTSVGKSVFKQCSDSSNDEAKWLSFGSPPKCYISGLKGPCPPGELLLPINENSIQGICMLEPSSVGIFPLRQSPRSKRDTIDDYEDGDDDLAYRISPVIRNPCRTGEIYSVRQRRCIRSLGVSF